MGHTLFAVHILPCCLLASILAVHLSLAAIYLSPVPCPLPLICLVSQSSKSIMITTHEMITPTNDSATALQTNSSPDDSRRSSNAEDQRMPETITRRLRFIIASPRWGLTVLISTVLFVTSSAKPLSVEVTNAWLDDANGIYKYNEQLSNDGKLSYLKSVNGDELLISYDDLNMQWTLVDDHNYPRLRTTLYVYDSRCGMCQNYNQTIREKYGMCVNHHANREECKAAGKFRHCRWIPAKREYVKSPDCNGPCLPAPEKPPRTGWVKCSRQCGNCTSRFLKSRWRPVYSCVCGSTKFTDSVEDVSRPELRLIYPTDKTEAELTLRKILLMGCSGLPSSEVKGCFDDRHDDSTQNLIKLLADADITVKWPSWDNQIDNRRRRLTSKVAGYGPHDNTAAQRRIRRLLASEAAGYAC